MKRAAERRNERFAFFPLLMMQPLVVFLRSHVALRRANSARQRRGGGAESAARKGEKKKKSKVRKEAGRKGLRSTNNNISGADVLGGKSKDKAIANLVFPA